MIEPKAVTLAAGEKQAFTPADKTFTYTPSKGKMAGNVYTAPWPVLIGKHITVTAPGEGEAVITLTSESSWMAIVVAYWLAVIPFLIWGLAHFWPQAGAESALYISPAAVTLKSGESHRFYATWDSTVRNDVTWSVTGGGTITPTGDYVAPAVTGTEDRAVEVTAKVGDGASQTARALVVVTPADSVIMSPSLAVLKPGESRNFTVAPPAAVFFGVSGAEGSLPAGPGPTKPFTAAASVTGTRQAAISASAGGRIASARVFVTGETGGRDNVICLMWVAALMGAAGAMIGTVRSFVNYVGARSFRASWGLYYLLHPVFAAGLALIVYAGFPSLFGSSDNTCGSATCANVMKVVFYSGLVGLFSDMFLEKLRDVVCNVFSIKDERPDKIADSTKSSSTTAATFNATIQRIEVGADKLTVVGDGFTGDFDATIDGGKRTVTKVNDKQLEIALDPATDTADKKVTVVLVDRATGAASTGREVTLTIT